MTRDLDDATRSHWRSECPQRQSPCQVTDARKGQDYRFDDDDNARIFFSRPGQHSPSHSHVSLDCTCLCWIMVLLAYTLVRVGVSNPMFLRHPSLTFTLQS